MLNKYLKEQLQARGLSSLGNKATITMQLIDSVNTDI